MESNDALTLRLYVPFFALLVVDTLISYYPSNVNIEESTADPLDVSR